MTISKRDAKLLLILLGIVIFIVAYLAVYNPYISRTEEIQAEISGLQPSLTELSEYHGKLDTYRAGAEKARQTIEEELEKYPVSVRPEDYVMYAITLEKEIGLDIDSIAFTAAKPMLSLRLPYQSGNGQYAFRDVTAYQSGMNISFSLDYLQLKRAIDYIAATRHRTSLDTVSISFNPENGKLLGTATVKKYFISAGDEPYEATRVPSVPIGTDNLFGTFNVTAGN